MVRVRTKAVAPRDDPVSEPFTAQEELDRDAEELAEANRPPLTDQQRFDLAFIQSDYSDVLVNVIVRLLNKITVLENTVNGTSKPPFTEQDVRDFMRDQLP